MTLPKDPAKLEAWRKNQSEKHKGKPGWNKGKPWSEEAKKKMSESQLMEKSSKWKGGGTTLIYTRIRKTLKPDVCEHCGSTEEHLHTHHIDRDRTNNNIENILVLCRSCHIKLHNKENPEKYKIPRGGWKHTEESKLKMSEAAKKRCKEHPRFGPDAPCWKGGKTKKKVT